MTHSRRDFQMTGIFTSTGTLDAMELTNISLEAFIKNFITQASTYELLYQIINRKSPEIQLEPRFHLEFRKT